MPTDTPRTPASFSFRLALLALLLAAPGAALRAQAVPTLQWSHHGLTGDLSGTVAKSAKLTPTLIATSPLAGEAAVSLHRETILIFDQVLDPSTVDESAVEVVAPGQFVGVVLKLSADSRRITLFYPESLPASSVVRVTVHGDQMLGVSGFKVDADGDGKPGGTRVFEFSTVSISPLTGTAICGRIFASELATDGSGLSVNVPLTGARVSVDGAEDTLFAITDAAGDFRLDPCPAGKFFVHVDGTVATSPLPPSGSYYPRVGKAWDPTPGQESTIGEIYLPLVPDGTLQPVSTTQAAVIGFAPTVLADYPEFAACSLTVPAGALFADNGSPGIAAGIAPVPSDRLPGPLPEQFDMGIVITVQTDGASNFDVPAPVVFPNVPRPSDGYLAVPGEKLALWSFNHDSGEWEIDGPATVSADGLTVASDPGFGIKAPGWHGISPCPNSGSAPPAGDPCFDPFTDCAAPIGSAGLGCAGAAVGSAGVAGCVTGAVGAVASTAAGVSMVKTGSISFSAFGAGAAADVGKTALACLEAVSPYAKAVGIALCVIDVGNAVANCALTAHFCDASVTVADSPGGAAADLQLAGEKLAQQGERLQAIMSPFVTVFGDPLWFQATDTPGQGVILAAWASTWADAAAESSASGVSLSPSEVAALLATPYPDQLSVSDVESFLARWNRTMDYWAAQVYEVAQVPSGQSTDFIAVSALQGAGEASLAAIDALGAEGITTLTGGVDHQFSKTWTLLASLTTRPVQHELYWSLKQIDSFSPVPMQRGKAAGGAGARRCCSSGGGGAAGGAPVSVVSWCHQVLDPVTLFVGTVFFDTEGIGTTTAMLPAILLPSTAPDTDGDGLRDDAEEIVGTLPNVFDSDGDGIGDGAELQNGTNPLDGLAAATGIIASVDTSGTARDVEALNDLAVVADGENGVLVFNVFNGMDPLLIASVSTPAPALDVAIDGSLIAVAMGSGGLAIVDMSNPLTAHITAAIGSATLGGTANRVVAAAGAAYVAGPAGRIAAVELAQGHVFDSAFTGAAVLDLALDGDVLWAVTGTSLLSVPLLDGLLDVAGSTSLGPSTLTVDTPRLFVGGGVATLTHSKGYSTFDISDATHPQLIASWLAPQQSWRDWAADGSGLAVACVGPIAPQADVLVLDAKNPAQLGAEVGLHPTPGLARDIAIYNGLAYVADDESGLQTVNYQSFDALGMPPVVDFIANVDGPTVLDEQLVLLRALVSDDVVVRHVEFWVEGERVLTDGGFPFEAFIPAHDADADGLLSIFVTARDTGGNTSTSATQTWAIVPDSQGPQVIGALPAADSQVFAFYLSQQGASFVFDEPVGTNIDASAAVSVVTAGIDGLLGTPDDAFLPHAAQILAQGRRLVVQVPEPPMGVMRLRLDDIFFADLAGNLLDGDASGTPGGDFTLQFTVMTSPSKAWDVPFSGTWNQARNWTGDTTPTASDLVAIDMPESLTVSLGGASANFLSLNCAESFVLNAGTLTPGFDAHFTGSFAQTGGVLAGIAPTFLEGASSWSAGNMTQFGPTVVSGTLTVDGNGDKSIAGGRSFDVPGTLTLGRSFNSFLLGSGGHINVLPGGLLDTQGDGVLSWDGAPASRILNSGTLRRSGSSGTFSFGAPVDNNGTIEVTTGALQFSGAVLGGSAQIDAGAELRFNGPSHLASGFNSTGAGTLRLDRAIVDTEALVQNARITNVGELSGPGTVRITGTLMLEASSIIGSSARVRVEPGGLMAAITNNSDKTILGTIENAGTVRFGQNLNFYGNASFTNLPGGLVDLDSSHHVGVNGGTPTSINQGLIHKTAGNGTQDWGLPLVSTGTIHVSSGTLRLNISQSITSTVGGQVLLDAGTELQFGANGHLAAGLAVTGAGSLRLTGTFADGDFSAETAHLTDGNPFTGPGKLSISQSMSWQAGIVASSARLRIDPGAQLLLPINGLVKRLQGELEIAGTMTLGDELELMGAGKLTNLPGGELRLVSNHSLGGSGSIDNQGTLRKTAGTGTQSVGPPLTTGGTVRVESGLLALVGSVTVTGGAFELAGGNLQIGFNLSMPAGSSFTGSGSATIPLLSTAGLTSPGLAGAGLLSLSGAFSQSASGMLQIQLGGTTPGSGHDRLAISNTATLGGTLDISLINGFVPDVGDTFTVMTYASQSGNFATLSGLTLGGGKKLAVTIGATDLTLTVVPDP